MLAVTKTASWLTTAETKKYFIQKNICIVKYICPFTYIDMFSYILLYY